MNGVEENNLLKENIILAVIDNHPEAARVLRAARRKAKNLNLRWEVAILEYGNQNPNDSKEQYLQITTLAQQMGATITPLLVNNTYEGAIRILKAKREQDVNIPFLFIGEEKGPIWLSIFEIPLSYRLRRRLEKDIKIIRIPLGLDVLQRKKLPYLKNFLKKFIIGALAAAVATLAVEAIHYISPEAIGTHNRNKPLIYIIACTFVASRYGFLTGIIAALSSFFVINLLYVSPYIEFITDDQADIVNLALFLTAAVIISLFGGQDMNIRKAFSRRAERLQSSLRIHKVTLNKKNIDDVMQTLAEEISKLLGTKACFFRPAIMNNLLLENPVDCTPDLSEADKEALKVCWEEKNATGVGSLSSTGCSWRFEPLSTPESEIGVLGAYITDSVNLDSFFGQLLGDIASQAALILEKFELGQIAEDSKIQAEREKLRAMLLSSVSHDLKTPLASIIGSLSVYRSIQELLTKEQQQTLITTALEEAQRLDSFITNILDMTRIESGQVELKQEWLVPQEILNTVTKLLKERLRHHHVIIHGNASDIEIKADSIMITQVLQNLLDNAVKYTNPGTDIKVFWQASDKGFILQISDSGAGIPEDQLEKIFDKYTRIRKQDNKVAGTGLGLAICKAVINAHGGNIFATNNPEGGSIFTITLPHWRKTENLKAA